MTLRITNRTARPVVALLRQPGPKRLSPELKPRRAAMGPLTILSTAASTGGAARHDRVDRDLLGSHRHLAIGDEAELLAGLEAGGFEHGAHCALGGRHHGQAVGPSLLVAELDGVVQVLDGMALGHELGIGHGRDYTPRSTRPGEQGPAREARKLGAF